MFEPMYSPWGNIQTFKILTPGVFEVTTASHGGIMVSRDCISETLSREAQKCGFMDGAYLCFEEDCDAPVVIRELLDKNLMKAPVNEFYKEGEYAECIDRALKQWHPRYWAYRSGEKPPAKKPKDREER